VTTTTSKTFFELTAEDLMSRDVVCIPAHTSLRAAARMLIEAGVSGAPVVDQEDRCLGVLSQTDLTRFLAQREPAPAPASHEDEEFASDWQMSDFDSLPADEVGRYLTRVTITASTRVPISELAALMFDARVHRVLIVDPRGKVVGIVSSLDVLRAVAEEPTPPA
jgi:CBS domain-containing membrane protein